MERMQVKNLNTPEEVRTLDKGKLELVKVNGATIGWAVFQPGWKWSESVKPIAKTQSCEAPHFHYHLSGTLRIRMNDGTERDLKPGDISYPPPGTTPGWWETSPWWSWTSRAWSIMRGKPRRNAERFQ